MSGCTILTTHLADITMTTKNPMVARQLVAVGAILSLTSVFLAVRETYSAWYTPFVLGSYVLFGSANIMAHGRSTLSAVYSNPRIWIRLYLILAVLGFIIDVPIGRLLGDLWIYPHFDVIEQFIHVWLIGYPFALLSAVETYWFFSRLFAKRGTIDLDFKIVEVPGAVRSGIMIIALILLLVALTMGIAGNPDATRRVLFILLIVGTVAVDLLATIMDRPSIFQSAYSRNFRPLSLAALSAPVIGAIHEIPNTFAREWVYQNIPLTDFEILGVNVLVLSIGWFALLLVPLSVIHVVMPPSSLPRV